MGKLEDFITKRDAKKLIKRFDGYVKDISVYSDEIITVVSRLALASEKLIETQTETNKYLADLVKLQHERLEEYKIVNKRKSSRKRA